jgi:hypothetical protein
MVETPRQFREGNLEVTICDLKIAASCSVRENMKSGEKRAALRLPGLTRAAVSLRLGYRA